MHEDYYAETVMDTAQQERKQNLLFLRRLIQCNYPLEHWVYAKDGHLMDSNSANERILDTIFL